MVKETRIVLDPSEFQRFRIICSCGGEVICPLRDGGGHLFIPPNRCPHCQNDWQSGGTSRQVYVQIGNLMNAVRYLSELPVDTPLSVRFEIDAEPEKK